MNLPEKGSLLLMVDTGIVVGVSLYLLDQHKNDPDSWDEGIAIAKFTNQEPHVGEGCCVCEEDLVITEPEEWQE